jgi:LL-diaminopimelate aminotransferase
MVKRNENICKLRTNYLFPEINLRKKEVSVKYPKAKFISLGIGDTTEPISPYVADAMSIAAAKLSTHEGYSGYGPEQGMLKLRQKISDVMYKGLIHPDEVFISDGSKCDIVRLQLTFGPQVTIAVQDPAYPVYVEGSVLTGLTKSYDKELGFYPGISYMVCKPENHFFPDLHQVPRTDLIYFCSPNNPTGACATKRQLQDLVAFARKNCSIIIYDAAYASYIQDPDLPKSIFEIDGASDVAIETNSLSKIAGFTGIRLGWTVVPEKLKYEDGSSVRKDWNRVFSTVFNGASNIAQYGGLAVFDKEGFQAVRELSLFYLENGKILKKTLQKYHLKIFGGDNAPYLWVQFPGRKSWDVFQELLEKAHIVTTPGLGFGPGGEGFLRFSAFGHREDINEAAQRLELFFK